MLGFFKRSGSMSLLLFIIFLKVVLNKQFLTSQ